jgi:hypothetical protein
MIMANAAHTRPLMANCLAIVEQVRWLNEALLLQQLGYVLICRHSDGQMYTIKDVREGSGEPNLEVLTLHGWHKPTTCWAELRKPVAPAPAAKQGGLF